MFVRTYHNLKLLLTEARRRDGLHGVLSCLDLLREGAKRNWLVQAHSAVKQTPLSHGAECVLSAESTCLIAVCAHPWIKV